MTSLVFLVTVSAVPLFQPVEPSPSESSSSTPSYWNTYRHRFDVLQKSLYASGAGNCSGTMCHGGAEPRPGEVILGDEWDRWYDSGKGVHFNAFHTLYEERSDRIVKLLYGRDAVAPETAECRACHAFDVPEQKRPKRFDEKEGVMCEACHGRAASWIGIHHIRQTWDVERSEEQRTALGFYDTQNLIRRAEKCLECHLGTATKRVTHRMLAAGHPPVALELVNDLERVPRHWTDKQSFLTPGEGSWFHARVWAVGQAVRLRESMYGLATWADNIGPPDYSFFNCYSCHHDLKNETRRSHGVSPETLGDPTFDQATVLMCRSLVAILLPDDAATYDNAANAVTKLLSIYGTDRNAIKKGAFDLAALADKLAVTAERKAFDRSITFAILQKLANDREAIAYQGYRAAVEMLFACNALYVKAVLSDRKLTPTDPLDDALRKLDNMLYDESGGETPQKYDPATFLALMAETASGLGLLDKNP
ncbi:MAG: multiheme c-type cytochrome [Planctomycetota bacterium]